jgi:hypothetical protein
MTNKQKRGAAGTLVLALAVSACGADTSLNDEFQSEFGLDQCDLSFTGRNEFFILEPGFQLVLESKTERLAITVLDETRTVDGVETRVVEEREWKNDSLIEVSRNFFAICNATQDVYYFGEDVDDYKDGKVVNHAGAWLAGENAARAGLIMSGAPTVGMKYYQEIAPGVALDRAEIMNLTKTFEVPAGTFPNTLRTKEGSGLKPLEREYKTYAPGIGLIQDQNLHLVEYGFVTTP